MDVVIKVYRTQNALRIHIYVLYIEEKGIKLCAFVVLIFDEDVVVLSVSYMT